VAKKITYCSFNNEDLFFTAIFDYIYQGGK